MSECWKPTRAGQYLLDGKFIMVALRDRIPIIWSSIERNHPPVQDGAWSLLAPEWQDGAPTVEQLSRWQWWAVEHDGRFLYCGIVRYAKGLESVGAALLNPEFITRSAPIQPVPGAPLWVPLEVCNG